MTGALLWLVALVALSLVAAISLRRVGGLAQGTHELERLQADVVGINERLAATVDPLVGRLDEVRRGALDPAELGTEFEAAREALRGLSRDARALQPPPALGDRVAQLAWELDRAVRAADMASHGVSTLGTARTRHMPSVEAEVALKRGTLGLRHAREAVSRLMTGLVRLTPAEVRVMPVPSRASRPFGIPTPPVDDEPLIGGGEEPPEP